LPRLVVKDGVAAIRALFDPIGARGQEKIAFSKRDDMFAGNLGENLFRGGPALALPASEPAGDT